MYSDIWLLCLLFVLRTSTAGSRLLCVDACGNEGKFALAVKFPPYRWVGVAVGLARY